MNIWIAIAFAAALCTVTQPLPKPTQLPTETPAMQDYSVPRQAINAEGASPELTPAQRKVVLTVLHASESAPWMRPIEKQNIFFALPKGDLVIYYGDARYPAGVVPEGDDINCVPGISENGGCRHGYNIIGARWMIYFPAPQGGPGNLAGYRISSGIAPGEPPLLPTPLDKVARNAYAHYRVRGPWDDKAL